MKHKEIDLAKDKIFENSVEYRDTMAVPDMDCRVESKKIDQADEVRDAIFDLLLDGKLDKTDIAIIEARNCSPMPSMREVAARVGINIERVHTRIKRIEALMPKELRDEYG